MLGTLLFPLVDKNMFMMYGIIRQKHIQKEFFLRQSVETQPESCIIHCFCVILHPYNKMVYLDSMREAGGTRTS